MNYYDQMYSSSEYYDYNYPSSDYQYAQPQSDRRIESDLVGAASGGGDCCPHVVDPTFFALTKAGIAVAVYALNLAITMNLRRRRKRRKRSPKHPHNLIFQESCDDVKCVTLKGRFIHS